MARINVEQQALKDPRFRHLGELLRCPRRFALDAGRGIMEHVWNHMTERWSPEAGQRAYCVTSDEVRRLFDGASFASRLCLDMVSADLAERTEFGFRVKGTFGRIEWLNRRREAARNNGNLGGRKPNLVNQSEPTSVNPLSPAPSPAPALPSGRSESSPKIGGISEPERRTPKPPRASSDPAGFRSAWDAYPHFEHRSDRADSLKAWHQLGLESKADSILAWIEAERGTSDWTKDGGRFVKGFQAWLRKRKGSFDAQPEPISTVISQSALGPKGQATARNAQRWIDNTGTEDRT